MPDENMFTFITLRPESVPPGSIVMENAFSFFKIQRKANFHLFCEAFPEPPGETRTLKK